MTRGARPSLGVVTPPAHAPRERLLGLLLLGIALVLLVSSPTWFASGQGVVGLAQIFLAVVLAGVGTWLYRRAHRTGGAPQRPALRRGRRGVAVSRRTRGAPPAPTSTDGGPP